MVDEPAATHRLPVPPSGDALSLTVLDFVAPWADGSSVVIDITGPVPQVTIRPSAPPTGGSALSFLAPWAAEELPNVN